MTRKLKSIEGWELATVGDLVVPNGLQTGPFGSQLKADEYIDTGGIPTVMPSDMANLRINTHKIARR